MPIFTSSNPYIVEVLEKPFLFFILKITVGFKKNFERDREGKEET
jgi:hypothetical protein